MNEQIREQLIGYVLGALDDDELQFVEQQLTRDAQWKQELEIVQRTLEPLAEGFEEYEAPPGLAARTCEFVAEEGKRLHVERPGRVRSCWEDGCEASRGWRLADVVVLAGVCMAAVSLLFPALLSSRLSSRIITCQNNLRDIGMALCAFSERSQSRAFPRIDLTGNRAFAGIYAPLLREYGFLSVDHRVLCPDSALARQSVQFRIPKPAEIDAATGEDVFAIQRIAGGTYAYTLGFVKDGMYYPPRNLGRDFFVIMADAPSLELGGVLAHNCGINVLFEDGHVCFIDVRGIPGVARDDFYTNRRGRIEAGLEINDAVVASSGHPPLISNTVQRIGW